MRRNIRVGLSFAFLLVAAGALGACQAGGATGTGASTSGSSSASDVSLVPGDPVVALNTGKKAPSFAGLSIYKRYNTTENLCKQTCRSESRCVKQSFTAVRKIGKYTAGQCQLFGR